jgi:tRNA (guanine-N7-)-methyltransferase
VLVIGAEPFVNGVASAVRHVEEQRLSNVRIHEGDARDVLGWLPDASVDRLFIMFPDPWHKARHNKRRLIQPAFVSDLARVLKPGAAFRFATDWADYADQTLCLFAASPDFEWTAKRADDWRLPPADHVTTRYEEKRLGDCAPVWLEFRRAA